ncbi:MAG: proline dehydrogenase family protein, partial [Phycisphaerae bacterium]
MFLEHGCRVRIYAPFGELIPGMSYLVRRLLENTSNDSFLRQNFTDHLSVEKLLMKPSRRAVSAVVASETSGSQFRNEPLTDFSVAENRDLMVQALADVKDQFGQIYPLVIDGKSCDSRATIVSRNPSCTSEIIGRIASASPEQALDAVNSARRSFPAWAALDTG